jgi:hypothetical protein
MRSVDDDESLRADLKRLRDRRAVTKDDRELRAIDALITEFEFRLRLLTDVANDR